MHMRRRGGPRTVKSGQLLLGPTGAGCLQPFPCIDCGLRLVEGPLALLRFQVNQEPLDHTVIHVMGPDALTPAEDNKGPDLRDVMRSEEHTSELQSLMRISYAVFCLKKKTETYNDMIKNQIHITTNYNQDNPSKYIYTNRSY